MGDPPSLNSEFTTGFPASKYMYELVFALSETFTRPLHEALFTPTAGLQAGAHTSASEQSRLRPWPSAAIWRACGTILGLSHEVRLHRTPVAGVIFNLCQQRSTRVRLGPLGRRHIAMRHIAMRLRTGGGIDIGPFTCARGARNRSWLLMTQTLMQRPTPLVHFWCSPSSLLPAPAQCVGRRPRRQSEH